jgi:alpha-galactosidase
MAVQMVNTFYRLDGVGSTMVWLSQNSAMPRLLYWADTLPPSLDLEALALASTRPVPHGGLDVEEVISWLPEPGRGFTDSPGLVLRRGQVLLDTQFQLTHASRTPTGWTFVLHDVASAAGLTLSIQVDAANGVFSANASLVNAGADDLQVDFMASLSIPVPAHFQTRLFMGGRWANEFQTRQETIHTDGGAAWLQESRVGRTSHHAYPGIFLLERTHAGANPDGGGDHGVDADSGDTWSVQLAWSGNHRLLMQPCRLGGLQLQIGELLLAGEVSLPTGARHICPTAHLARSSHGLSEVSRRWHQFIRSRLQRPVKPPRPVQFSTWEATYFDHDMKRLKALASAAAALGIERFVLDDGWFTGRHNDRAGLGDWMPCPVRYPEGLAPLASHCLTLGMAFGLWVEPESINRDSALFRAHPQWVLGGATASQPLGRHQFVLNLGLPEVRAHLMERFSALLQSAPISFLKWDMNRDMTHAAGADGNVGARAHVLGLYQLMDALRAGHPALEIESCASGGARADLGILPRVERIWLSDCNDPLVRQRSQRGFLRFMPPELMGAHVGDALSHTTQRSASIAVRTLSALFGHFGVEADLLAMPQADHAMLKAAIQVYKAERLWLHDGIVMPLPHQDPAICAVLAQSRDGSRALVSVVALALPRNAISEPLRVPGLKLGADYRVDLHPLWQAPQWYAKQVSAFHAGAALTLPTQALASSGLSLPPLLPGQGILIQLDLIRH